MSIQSTIDDGANESFIGVLKELNSSIKEKSYDSACRHAHTILKNKNKYPRSIINYASNIVERYAAQISNGYHLSINPSYATQQEIGFWNGVHATTKAYGAAKIKELRFRKFAEDTLHEDSIVHPARLSDLFNLISNKHRFNMTSLPGWVSSNDVALHVDWEHRRWQIDKYDHRIEKGFIQLCWYIDSYVNTRECVSVITSNKLDHPNRLGFLAAQRLGKSYSFVERSPFMGHLIEPRGMFGESKLKDFLVSPAAHQLTLRQEDEQSAKSILINNIMGSDSRNQPTIRMNNQYPFFLPRQSSVDSGSLRHPQS